MGSLNPGDESKQELNDSGYVQDDSKPAEYRGTAQLLDLSDDVLLYILRNCTPQELKALGFTCPRLGSLVLDRTLWVDVDTAGVAHGRRRVRWLLSQALGPHTKRLRLCGYAKQAEGCLGFMNRYDLESDGNPDSQDDEPPDSNSPIPSVYRLSQGLPRYGGGFPYWPSQGAARPQSPDASEGCPGPQLTLTHTGLRELVSLCTGLRTLELEDCVIDCQTTNIGMFPKTLTKLSLKGTKCFNLESKSFLFKIQDHLTHLEELDVSYCTWIEPACMLPLSKMPCLKALAMRECHKLAEFVAYASLATRYGFKKLKYLDLRGSPVGDSEVSALGWLPALEELHLAPAPKQTEVREHAHYSQDIVSSHVELEEWEEMEPDYFKPPDIPEEEWLRDEDDVRGNRTRYYTTNTDDPSARLAEAERALTSILGLSLNEVEAYVRRRQDREAQREPPRPPAACILLERMIAEPVAPEEYAQVYHQFLAGHNSNIPLANPEEYREAYRQYMSRPHHGRPPAGYSLFIRKPAERRREAAKRRREHHPPPGPSSQNNPKASTSDAKKNQSDDAKPGPSNSRPKPDPPKKRDSDDSSDDDSPAPKRAAIPQKPPANPAKKDSNGGKKSTKKEDKRDGRNTRRVFEITINELNAHVHELIDPNDMNVDGNQMNVRGNQANVGGNDANVSGNEMNVDGNEVNVGGNEMNVDGNEMKAGGNDGNDMNVGGNEMDVANDDAKVVSNDNQANDKAKTDVDDKKDGSDKVNTGGNNNGGVNANCCTCNMGGNSNTRDENANPRVNPNEGVNYNAANERGNANNDFGSDANVIPNVISRHQVINPNKSGDANGGGNANPGVSNASGGGNANSSANYPNERGDAPEGGNANKGGNVNAKCSVNVEGNANVDVNANVRGNDNAEGSVNVGGNSIADVNANIRGNDNENVNARIRDNDNADVNANVRGNDNENVNASVRGNDNENINASFIGNDNADVIARRCNANARGKVNARRNSNPGNRPSMIDYAAINPPPNELLNPISRQRLLQFRTYRRPIVIEEFINECEEQDGPRRLPQRVLFSGLPGNPARLDHTALVSDSSIRRFGRAIGENIAYIHIGGGGAGSARPDRSSLRVLSVSGYRHITDASLTHLATAAPRLRALDVTRTAVTPRALAAFRALRPDVDVTADTQPDPDMP